MPHVLPDTTVQQLTVGFWDVRPLGEDFDYYCVELLKRKDPLPLHDSHYDKRSREGTQTTSQLVDCTVGDAE